MCGIQREDIYFIFNYSNIFLFQDDESEEEDDAYEPTDAETEEESEDDSEYDSEASDVSEVSGDSEGVLYFSL